MNNVSVSVTRLAAVLLLSLLVLLVQRPGVAQNTNTLPTLFDVVQTGAGQGAVRQFSGSNRTRALSRTSGAVTSLSHFEISINPRTFRRLAALASPMSPVSVNLPVSDGPPLRALLTQTVVTPQGSLMLSGFVAGDGASQLDFLLTARNAMTGSLRYTDAHGVVRTYRTAFDSEGAQVFERFVERNSAGGENDVQRLHDMRPDLVSRSLALGQSRRHRSFVDDGRLIDIMVLYSSGAQQLLGGREATESAIEFSVEKTNSGWSKSRIQPRIRLVYSDVLRNYEDSGLIDLDGLAGNGDGLVDYIHSLRNTVGADLVMIIGKSALRRPGQRVCGIGYFPNEQDPNGDIVGFSYVQANCIVGALSFPHEIGHNLGALHDRTGYNGGNALQSNYGYVTPSRRFRTVMAYSRGCGSSYCPRINLWSSPTLKFRGEALGRSTPTSDSADNVRQLNGAALRVSRYRRSRTINRPAIILPRPQTWLNGDGGMIYFADNGVSATAWRIKVGSRRGIGDYFVSGTLRKGQRNTRISGVPTDGRRIFVTLEYRVGLDWLRSVHIYRSYTKEMTTILTELQPLRELMVSIPGYAFSSPGRKRFLLQRLNLLQQAVKANNIDLVHQYRSQFRARTNGCPGATQFQPDANDFLINCNMQSEVDVYFRQISIAARNL